MMTSHTCKKPRPPNGPSKTEGPSGKHRGNNPPARPAPAPPSGTASMLTTTAGTGTSKAGFNLPSTHYKKPSGNDRDSMPPRAPALVPKPRQGAGRVAETPKALKAPGAVSSGRPQPASAVRTAPTFVPI